MLTEIENGLFQCDYCSNIWDGCAQCPCWGSGDARESASIKNVCINLLI